MSEVSLKSCQTEITKVLPQKPWTQDMTQEEFQPLINLIDDRAQSDMLRRVGRYSANKDYYDFAAELIAQGKVDGERTEKSGVTENEHVVNGWPYHLTIEDKAAQLKETVDWYEYKGPDTGTLRTDKVEYCGVSRYREFRVDGSRTRLAYSFPGGTIDLVPGAADKSKFVLQLDKPAGLPVKPEKHR